MHTDDGDTGGGNDTISIEVAGTMHHHNDATMAGMENNGEPTTAFR
jgi:hypothetical protein